MDEAREPLIAIGGSVVAVLLQIMLAPSIAIGSAMPNFIMMFTLALAVVRPGSVSPVLPFVMGLLYDLLGFGPVGAFSFLLLLASLLVMSVFQVLDNDAPIMPFVAMTVAALAVEVLYAAFMLGAGVEANIVEALIYRALPCALYDIVVGVLLFLALSRLLSGGTRAKFGQSRL